MKNVFSTNNTNDKITQKFYPILIKMKKSLPLRSSLSKNYEPQDADSRLWIILKESLDGHRHILQIEFVS